MSSQTILFHASNHYYNVGEEISNTYCREFINTLESNNIRKIVEDFFELNRPFRMISRLDSVFAFNNLTNCENYAANRLKYIYEVEPTVSGLYSVHNYKVISFFLGRNVPTLPDLEHNIHLVELYWQNFPGTIWIDHVNVPIYYDSETRKLMGPNWNGDQYIEEVLIGCPVVVKKVYQLKG